MLGWGIGGILGGVIADYTGRKRMMMYSILAYASLTGLSALAWSMGIVRGPASPIRVRATGVSFVFQRRALRGVPETRGKPLPA